MNILRNSRLDLEVLKGAIAKPEIFTKSTAQFWDDVYISSQMLQFHLDPDVEAASKRQATIEAETKFIINYAGLDRTKAVLDLGCGPGLYVREFAGTGATVTGVDLSGRSVDYANRNIKQDSSRIEFRQMNYLDLDYQAAFDVVTLIFYDFCVLRPDEQDQLLAKIHAALKADGLFVFDVVTAHRKTGPATRITVCEGGFWSPDPYIEIYSTFIYERPKTEGMHYTIIDESGATRVIRLYHRLFELAELTELLVSHGFAAEGVYRNLQGDALTAASETYGLFARKVR